MATVFQFIQKMGVEEKFQAGLSVYPSTAVKTNDMVKIFTIKVITRSNRLAGFFDYKNRQIGLHAELFIEGRENDLRDTFLHELSHMIATVAGVEVGKQRLEAANIFLKPHGRGWAMIMLAMGQKPNTCHEYPYLIEKIMEAKKHRFFRYEYVCQDCGHTYKKSRLLSNEDRRYHGSCLNKPNKGRLTRIDKKAS